MRLIKAAALALLVGMHAGCASMPLSGRAHAGRSVSQVASLDVQAYAALRTYALALEQARRLASRAETPDRLVQALARAEAAATPVVESLAAALTDYLRARSAFAQAPGSEAARAMTAADAALSQAVASASAPLAALTQAIKE